MAPTEEDLAWFRSTFHAVPKPRLPDDCVDYRLYVFDQNVDPDHESDLRLRLREVQKHASDLQKKWLKDYIWQRQEFRLELGKEDGLTLLKGQTEYGDSVEDEWVIVWLLRELTREFDDLWIKVSDNDGEFLLVEAAGTLPEWLEPEVAENRVWIHHGNLCILKPESTKSKKKSDEKLSVQAVRATVLQQPSRLLKSTIIEAEAFHRLRNYPKQITENMHHTMVTMPRKAAFLLHQKAAYIAPAVEAFYLRDPISLKPLQSPSPKSLIFAAKDFVTFTVKLPRVGFAQLKGQDFRVPAAWVDKLPPQDDTKEYEEALVGMKLSCGFEMLLSDPQNRDKPSVREMKMLLEDLETGDEKLPSDRDVSQWPRRHDDEKWLDISFEDLEGELNGKSEPDGKKRGEFGDRATQENLQRIVAQFERFLNDDTAAGPDAAGMFGEETDDSGDDVSEDDLESDGEDEEASFNEDRFAKMMHEMMGMGGDADSKIRRSGQPSDISRTKTSRVEELSSDDDDNHNAHDTAEIQAQMRDMEAELKEAGALDLGPMPSKPLPTKQASGRPHSGKRKQSPDDADDDDDDDDDDENDADADEDAIDVNLVRNLLESFKNQTGTPGPGSNLMNLMGLNSNGEKRDQKK